MNAGGETSIPKNQTYMSKWVSNIVTADNAEGPPSENLAQSSV